MKKLFLHLRFANGTVFRFVMRFSEEKGFYHIAFFLLIFSLIPFQNLFAQNNTAGTASSIAWTSSPFAQNDFIENKGQFDGNNGTKADVLFAATGSSVHVYFSQKGLTYRYDEWVEMSEAEIEEFKEQYEETAEHEKDEENMHKKVPRYLHMEWVGANRATEVTAEEKVSHYYTYATNKGGTIVAHAYRKIIYKNLYPGIDVEYIIPEDKEGLKYSVILHPGADASLVKMKYIDEEKIFFDGQNNAVITSVYGNFTDHAPHTFYSNDSQVIESEFMLQGDEVSFRLGNYDASKEIIIDPWTSSPGFSTNRAYDVNFDLAGNVYAYGSVNPFQLCKFNNAGVLQWIYNAVGLYNSGCTGVPYGDFAVDEVNGTSYIAEAFNPSTGTHVYKVNTNGILAGTSPAITQFNELWRIEYNRCINKLIGAGGGTSGTNQGIVIDTNLAAWTPVNVLSTNQSFHDMALLSIDNGSNFCYMVAARASGNPLSFDNTLVKCPIPSLMPVFSVASGHTFQESTGAYDILGGCANGFNGITNSPTRLYTYDGVNLKRWNKTSGAFVNSLVFAGTPFNWGGIWADECNNIYVGYQNTILRYDSLYALLNTFTLPGTVYDVKLGINNKLYACGNGFVTSIDVPANNMSIINSSTPSDCLLCTGTATVNGTSCNGGSFNYLWQPGGQTTQTATSLCAGVYTVTLTSNCNNTFTATVTVNNTNAPPVLVASATQTICIGQSATLTASGASTYTWSPSTALSATTGSSVTANPTSTTTYTVTGDLNGCTSTAQITVVVNPLPVLIVSPTQNICNGQSATLTASGANTYSWSPSTALSATTGSPVSANPASTTTYTVTATDNNGCSSSAQVTVNVNPLPVVSVTQPPAICLGQQTATLTAGGASTYSWSPSTALSATTGSSVTANPAATTTYTVTGTDNNGCTSSAQVTVNVNPLPVVSVTQPPAICLGQQSATLTASGANTYSWSPSTALSATTGSTVTANPAATTTYTVTGTNNNGCTASTQVTVNVNPLPVVSVTQPPAICQGQQTATLTAIGANTYSWSPSTALSATTGSSVTANPAATTTYTVTGTNNNGCTASTQVTVNVNALPVVSIIQPPAICLGQQIATLTASGANTYSWSPSTALSATTGSSVTANPAATTTYTVTGTNNNGCTASAQVTVNINALPVISITQPPAICQGQQTATLTANGANTYSWSPSTALSATTGSSVTANPAATTTYTVTGTDNNGCTASAQVTVNVNPLPVISITQPPAICLGQQTATLTASGANTYSWSPSTALSATTGSSVTTNPVATTIYTVTGADNNGCTSSAQVTVNINPLPVVSIAQPTPICQGQQTATLTASGANTYAWSPSTALSATTGSSVIANPAATTLYTVIGTDNNGCTSSAQVTVIVSTLPVLSVSPSPTICNGQSATLTVNGANTYSWSPTTSLSATTGSSVTANPSSTVTYTVTGDLGGCTSTAQVTVTVNPLPVLSVSPPQTICNGQPVALSAAGANTYAWSPSTSLSATTGSSVTASPSSTITYTVTGDLNGCTATAQITVTVSSLPVLSISPAQTICSGQQITLTAGGANTYSWSPSTALNSTTGASVTANPLSTTTYTVTGDINGCTATIQVTVTVNPTPVLSVSSSPAICNGQSTTLSASGAQTYSWSPSTALSSTTGASVTASPSSTISYTVTGDLNGCTATAQVVVTVNPLPVVTVSPSPTICNGQSTVLTAGGANTYSWIPSTALNSTTGTSVTANPAATIIYTVTGDLNGCTATAQVTVTVNPLPIVSLSPSQTICDGQSAALSASGANTYAWSPSSALSSTTGSSVVSNPSSTTTYTVTGDMNGCTVTAQVTVTVNPLPLLSVSPLQNICSGQTATLTAAGANTYSWTPSTGLSSTTGPSVFSNLSSTTTYTVTGDLNGCTAAAQVTVTVSPMPVADFLPDSLSGCSPVTAAFIDMSSISSPSTIVSWIWNFGDNASGNSNTSTLQNPSHTYISPGSYTVTLTVTSNDGCVQKDSVINLVTVYANPVASFYAAPKIVSIFEPVITFTNTSLYYDFVLWNFGDNNTSNQISPNHTYSDTGKYVVVMLVTTTLYGCADTAYEEITVLPEFSFFIPNVFTPNHDGMNEVFTGLGVGVKESIMYIYDRWGEIIFQSNDLEKPWDGTVTNSDKIAQEGVYVYLITVIDIFNRKHQYIGSVTLLK